MSSPYIFWLHTAYGRRAPFGGVALNKEVGAAIPSLRFC
jgi:hypothetical protein